MDMIEFLEKVPEDLRPHILMFRDSGWRVNNIIEYSLIRRIVVVVDKSYSHEPIHSIEKFISVKELCTYKYLILRLLDIEQGMELELIDHLKSLKG